MTDTTHMPYALWHGRTKIVPRPEFAFRRLPQKLFFIGFNKTATSALFLLLLSAGVRTIHSSGNGKLFGRTLEERAAIPHATKQMAANLDAGHDPLAGLEAFDCFMDLTTGPRDLCLEFKTLHAAYPDATFVLNTRPKDAWITSRINHGKSVTAASNHFGIPKAEVPTHWASLHDAHHAAVRSHFADAPPHQFLDWDITSPVTQLTEFLAQSGITADPAHFFRIRETKGLHYPPPIAVLEQPQDVPILPATQD